MNQSAAQNAMNAQCQNQYGLGQALQGGQQSGLGAILGGHGSGPVGTVLRVKLPCDGPRPDLAAGMVRVAYNVAIDGWVETPGPANKFTIDIAERVWRTLSSRIGADTVIPCQMGLTDSAHLIAMALSVESVLDANAPKVVARSGMTPWVGQVDNKEDAMWRAVVAACGG